MRCSRELNEWTGQTTCLAYVRVPINILHQKQQAVTNSSLVCRYCRPPCFLGPAKRLNLLLYLVIKLQPSVCPDYLRQAFLSPLSHFCWEQLVSFYLFFCGFSSVTPRASCSGIRSAADLVYLEHKISFVSLRIVARNITATPHYWLNIY